MYNRAGQSQTISDNYILYLQTNTKKLSNPAAEEYGQGDHVADAAGAPYLPTTTRGGR